MLTQQETVRLQRIKQMALRGLAAQVSREDKQWVLDITARENAPVPAQAALHAMKEGFDLTRCTIEAGTVVA